MDTKHPASDLHIGLGDRLQCKRAAHWVFDGDVQTPACTQQRDNLSGKQSRRFLKPMCLNMMVCQQMSSGVSAGVTFALGNSQPATPACV